MQKQNNTSVEKGKLLIAHPFINDGWFRKTVILLAEHNPEGSLGFVLNKPAFIRLKDILPDYPDLVYPVFKGGPVATDQLFFLHQFPDKVEGSLPIFANYYWGGDFNQLINLVRKRVAGYDTTRFFVGYSGWDAGQLQNEMKDKAWLCETPKKETLFTINTEEHWGKLVNEMSSNLSVFANYPFEPNMN